MSRGGAHGSGRTYMLAPKVTSFPTEAVRTPWAYWD